MAHFFRRYPVLAWAVATDIAHRIGFVVARAAYRHGDLTSSMVRWAVVALGLVASVLALVVVAQVIFRPAHRARYRALFLAHPVGAGWAGIAVVQALLNAATTVVPMSVGAAGLVTLIVLLAYYIAWRSLRWRLVGGHPFTGPDPLA